MPINIQQAQYSNNQFSSQDQLRKISRIHHLLKDQMKYFHFYYTKPKLIIDQEITEAIQKEYSNYLSMLDKIINSSDFTDSGTDLKQYLSALYGEENIGEKEKVRQLIEKRCTAKYPQFRRYSVYLKMKNRVRRRMLKQILLSYADPTLTSEELSEERERLFEKYMSIQQMTVHEKQNQPFDGAEGREANQIFEFLEHFHFKNRNNPTYLKMGLLIKFSARQSLMEQQVKDYLLYRVNYVFPIDEIFLRMHINKIHPENLWVYYPFQL